MDTPRVAITGLGLVSPLGSDIRTFWHCLREGQSGIVPITSFDASSLRCRLAGEVNDFDPTDFMSAKQARRMSRASQFAVAAALMAVRDARLTFTDQLREVAAIYMGTSIAGLREALDAHEHYLQSNRRHYSPFTMTTSFANAVSSEVCIALNLHGPCETVSSGCSSTAAALARGYELIRSGMTPVVIVGGAEAPLHHSIMAAMDAGRMLADDEEGTIRSLPRPFDQHRNGTIVGEGAGVMILEDYAHAKARAATIYALVEGYASTCDAFSMAKPNVSGTEQSRAIKHSIRSANWFPEEVDYINACGLGTKDLDAIETAAIKQALGSSARRIPVSSFKGALGHAFAASGAYQIIGTALIMRHQYIPPTLNYTTPDPLCDLDYVPHHGREARVDRALINSFGFGGKNVVVSLSRTNCGVVTDSEPAEQEPAFHYALTAAAGRDRAC